MAQYLAIKARHPDALVFFRMGDFFELFFDDAVEAARILDITLTARGEHDGKPIPMAGVPYHAADAYLARLIRSGARVAVCEQVESPSEARKRGSKAIVARDVVRVVTPGTLTEDTLLAARQGQALAALAFGAGGREAALAVCDVSTGAFEVAPLAPDAVADALLAWPLSELIVTDGARERTAIDAICDVIAAPLTYRPARLASAATGESLLKESFAVAALDAFGAFSRTELAAIGLLLDYVKLTQAGTPARLDTPRRPEASGVLAIDPATRASLEIDRTLSGAREGALLHCIDRTVTPPGARLLAAQLARPSCERSEILARQASVGFLFERPALLASLTAYLKAAPDIERARARLRLGRGGPRDLAAIGQGLSASRAAATCLLEAGDVPPDRLSGAAGVLRLTAELQGLAADLGQALTDAPALLARDGGYIASGWDRTLDETRSLRDDSRSVIASLQSKYASETGISALKIKFNNVLGYFIEVPARFGDQLMQPPLAATFHHRQTLSGAARFSTGELADLAARVSRADEDAKAFELAIFESFSARVDSLGDAIGAVASALAALDVAASHAAWAAETGAVRPDIADEPVFEAHGLRHPVVEAALKTDGKGFTANDVRLDAGGVTAPRLLLVTGPNMAGKSTYLRQAALAVILAQAGGFVPARSLRLGLADRVFSRVGASDDLARGRSTFMVEMVETATILTRATARSFVILDEVGRGTSTWDGLAIAWAAVEHLHDVTRARAIFATHYHELTSLAESLAFAANASLRAREWKQDLIFLHEVQPGAADRSYGVQVARLAGLPKTAVARAMQVLKRLESDGARTDALPLFAGLAAQEDPAPALDPAVQALAEAVAAIDPDALSPRQALEALYALKALVPRE